MGRLIKLESSGKDRTRLTKAMVVALRELIRQTETGDLTRDLAAFLALALEEIADTIEPSVGAWEKRGYWVKADRFRMEWAWSERLAKSLREAVLAEDWDAVRISAVELFQRLQKVDVPQNHRLGTPWIGAWERIRQGTT